MAAWYEICRMGVLDIDRLRRGILTCREQGAEEMHTSLSVTSNDERPID